MKTRGERLPKLRDCDSQPDSLLYLQPHEWFAICIVQTLLPLLSMEFSVAWPCYRGHLGPSGRKLQIEFENGFPGPLGPGAQKVQNGVEKESKSTIFQLF